jgi:hypothetical protein
MIDLKIEMSVKEAEATIAKLEAKRAACVRQGTELQDERTSLAYSAHANNDAKATRRLEEVHAAIATHASELQSIDAALKAAAEKLAKAREHEAQKADRALAKEVKQVCSQFVARAERLDELGAEYANHAAALEELGAWLNSHGFPPTGMQRVTFFSLAIHSFLMHLPQAWRRTGDFRHLASNEKRNFSTLCKGWATAAENNIAARTKETEDA